MKLLRLCGTGLLPLAFCMCFFLALHMAAPLAALPALYGLYQENGQTTAKEAAEMQKREKEEKQPVAFTAWGQQSGRVENPNLGRSTEVSFMTLCGSSGLLYPDAPLLLPEDTKGCLLDKNTADSLFGTAAPIGSTVVQNGVAYIVRGIVDSSVPVVLVQGAPGSKAVLDHVTLQLPAGESVQAVLSGFGNRHSILGSWLPLQFWAQAANGFAQLAPVLGLCLLLCACLKTAFGLTARPVPFALCVILAGGMWFLLLWLTGFSFAVPQDWIPGKWSDFDFWAALWQERQQELLLQFTTPKGAPELALFQQSLGACLYGFLALVLFPVSLARLRPHSLRALWVWCFLFLVLAFGAVYLLQSAAVAESRLAWCFPVFYLAGAYTHSRFRQWTKKLEGKTAPTQVLARCKPVQSPAARHYKLNG